MPTAFEQWDPDEEKARERRIEARRERVMDRLRQQQQSSEQGDRLSAAGAPEKHAGSRCEQQVQQSKEAMLQLLQQVTSAADAVRLAADQRCEQHREACEAEEEALRDQVAAEGEGSKRENRSIDLEWEKVQGIKAPQELHAAIQAVWQHCQAVLQSKDAMLGAIQALLKQRDEQYVKLLQVQAEETDSLIASMHREYDRFKAAREQELEAVEAAYLQERSELLAAQKAELGVLLEQRSAQEQEFMEQYLAACEQYEEELERLRVEGVREHSALKRRLDGEIAALESHLDGIRAAYMLNADKLDYNYHVLAEREKESKEALLQQKRRITRQWEVLNRLKKRHAVLDARAAADNARLGTEYQAVTRAFNHLQSKFRHFKAADLARFEQIREMKKEELGQLLEDLMQAENLISSFVSGLPLPDPAATQSTSSSLVPASPGGSIACPDLELVGRAVTLDPGAAAAAQAAAFGPGGEAQEVLELSAGQAAERSQLIPAHRPSKPASAAEASSSLACSGPATGMLLDIDPVAWEELRASADSGALGLLLAANTDSRRVDGRKVRQFLAQVPPTTTAPDGKPLLSADAVARSLGLHDSAAAALGKVFQGYCGDGVVAGDMLAETIQPRWVAAEGGEGSIGAGAATRRDSGQPALPVVFSVEQVEQGLGLLVQLLAACSQSAPTSSSASSQQGGAAQHAGSAEPISRQYWEAKVEAAVPAAVLSSWQLLERQASQQFASLQARTAEADQVLALRQENERLKATLTELLTNPINKELQLPPTLLLR